MKLQLIGFVGFVPMFVLAGCGGATATADDNNQGSAAAAGYSASSAQGGGTSTSPVTSVGSSVNRGGAMSGGGSTSKGGSVAVGGAYTQGGSPVTSSGSSSGFCTYGKSLYPVGAEFQASDGCNSCYCEDVNSIACTAMDCWIGCEYDGIYVQPGESVASSDGCNTCTCTYYRVAGVSQLTCTAMGCVGSCSYAGRTYSNGASFMATDGCNKCSCSNGNVSCTEMGCLCNPDGEYWRAYIGFSAENCAVIDYSCPIGSSHFANPCGCGCEQSPECPSVFACTTDTALPYAEGAGGASSVDIAEMPIPAGGNGSGAPYSTPIECATAAQRAACPLTPTNTYVY